MYTAYYVARGDPAYYEATTSIETLRRFWTAPITLITDQLAEKRFSYLGARGPWPSVEYLPLYKNLPDCDPGGRMAKIRLLDFTDKRADWVLYLDADTRVINPIDSLITVMEAGAELAICPSANQGSDLLWHLSADEREQTLLELGNPEPLQLQGGVFAIRRNPRTAELCRVWLEEWQRWRGPDQGALLRALRRVPMPVYLLGPEYNNGSIIQHRFGSACDEQTKTGYRVR